VYGDGARLELFCSGEYQGLPYCLPYKNGNFLMFDLVEGYTKANEIDVFSYWNVGPDGQLCTADDVLLAHESELHYNTASPSYNELRTFANKYVKMDLQKDQNLNIGGEDFIISCSKSKVAMGQAEGNCYDVMDVNDCKLLFNSCDPVMCPPSRFNLNGRWQVDNVVESGMIGSLVLGIGNGDIVPVCLTGILSNLKYLDSMLDGYVECLEAAKFEGKSVGICDKVKSVYVCEIITREVASIIDSGNGGLLDLLASKLFGREEQGGGEYMKVKEAIGRMQDSVSFLTTQYATTAFAAFRGRTLEEVGTEICKQAIYANTPWFEDLMGQLTTPEDPTQFYASLTSKVYAPSQGETAYQTYYHIYAGTNENIERVVYTVYLKNSLTSERYEVTGECEGASAILELGGMVDQTIDCIGPEGMDTVCVVLNGETHCGFGSVATAFSSDYMKNLLIADEAQRNISTEEQCYPSYSTASPSVSSLATLGMTNQFNTVYGLGGLSTGVQRVCSISNPGAGSGGSSSWAVVGDCGEDSMGRSLGDCWINKDSINIQDAERSEKVNDYLDEVAMKKQKEAWGIYETYDSEKSAEEYTKFVKEYSESNGCGVHIELMNSFLDLYQRTTSFEYAASAQYYIGLIFYDIAMKKELCDVSGREKIKFEVFLDGKSFGTMSEYRVESDAKFELIIQFQNLEENDLFNETKTNNDVEINCDDDICSVMLDMSKREGDTIEVPIVIESTDKAEVFSQTFKFSINAPENTFVEAEELCGQCGEGIFSFCSVDECHNSPGCFFHNKLYGYFGDKCFACEELSNDYVTGTNPLTPEEKCNYLSYDKEMCNDNECYDKFLEDDKVSGKCYWDSSADEGEQCKYSDGAGSSVDLSEIIKNRNSLEWDDPDCSNVDVPLEMELVFSTNNNLHTEPGSGHGYVKCGAAECAVDLRVGETCEEAHENTELGIDMIAVFDGTVTEIFDVDAGDCLVLTDTGESYRIANDVAIYCHINPSVEEFDSIEEGDVVGTLYDYDCSGDTFGPHLHFELKKDGDWISGDGFFETWKNQLLALRCSGESIEEREEESYRERDTDFGSNVVGDLDVGIFGSMMQRMSDDGIVFDIINGDEDRVCLCNEFCGDYANVIFEVAEEYDIDPFLLLAIMIQETDCDAEPESASGCYGLMQICGNTWSGCISQTRIDSIDDLGGEDNYDKNIECGAVILKAKFDAIRDSKKYDCGYEETYSGWAAAVRGYNGWTSSSGCRAAGDQVYYVENVEEIYDQLIEEYSEEER
jgi:hypothetical protein